MQKQQPVIWPQTAKQTTLTVLLAQLGVRVRLRNQQTRRSAGSCPGGLAKHRGAFTSAPARFPDPIWAYTQVK